MSNSGQFHDTVLKPPLTLKWRYFTEGTFKTGPIVINGKLFATDRQGQVYCLDSETGELLWKRYYLASESVTPIAWGNYLYYHETGTGYYDRNGYLRCVNQNDGKDVWVRDNIGGTVYKRGKFSPQIFNGKLYFFGSTGTTTNTATLYCLDASTGETIWEKVIGPITDAQGIVPDHILVCTLAVKPFIISAYSSNAQTSNRNKYGQAFAVTADSGKLLWETSVYHNVHCIYDTVLYAHTASPSIEGIIAASVFTGDTLYGKKVTSAYKFSATDKYLFTRTYGGSVSFLDKHTGNTIGSCDFASIPIPAGGKVLSGCGFVSMANGYGYCGFGHGGYSVSTYNPPGGAPRSDKAQGVYAFEIPKNNETSLKVVWYYKMASNICSTPYIANGKIYYTTNQEGAIYCFENE
jgi:outer membrane protein assembly factor BamB